MPEKMKISATICELNPMHFGHLALFHKAKEISDALICILSGNFVQRGEPAIVDKWARCRLALESGADLVAELPLPWACAGAERFAAGGVRLADAFGNVDFLLFGSEEPDLKKLDNAANALISPQFSSLFAAQPDTKGETFARRRETALTQMLGENETSPLRQPNALLGVEYLKALKQGGSTIKPVIFPRLGSGHDQRAAEGKYRSAGELRELLRKNLPIDGLAPAHTVSLLQQLRAQGRFPADPANLERSILCKLRAMNEEDFALLPDISEGLEHRLYRAARQAGSLEELYALTKSKRYALSRIRRLVLFAFLGVTRDQPDFPPYLRILGMTEKGERVLKDASPSLPLAVRPADFEKLGGRAFDLFKLEARADDLYDLAFPVPAPCGKDYTEKLIRPTAASQPILSHDP